MESLDVGAAEPTVQARESHVEATTDLHQILTTPIHRIPAELLVRIFSNICDESINVLQGPGEIWTLQQVCTRWRSVVRDTPLLWSNICAREPCTSQRCKDSVALTRTQQCLELSRSVLLSVTLHTTIREIVSALAGHAHRWKYLKLDYAAQCVILGRNDSDTSDTSETMIQPGVLNHLQALDLAGSYQEYCDLNMFDIFRGSNALECVKLDYCLLPSASEFPWANLKRLSVVGCKVGGTSAYDIGSLFRALSHLEELEWTYNNEMLRPMLSVMTLPSLRRLKFTCSQDMPIIMSMLRFPRLTKLEIMDGILTDINCGPILTMIRMSGCSIKALDLPLDSDNVVLLEILRETRTVEELFMIISPEQSSEVLTGLIWDAAADSEGSSSLLPSLRQLEVRPYGPYPTDLIDLYVDRMARIIHSRGFFPVFGGGAAEIQGRRFPSATLSHVISSFDIDPVEEFDTYRGLLDDLEDFGKRCGVEVEIAATAIIRETRNS